MCIRDSLAYSTLEALATGKPIVGFNIPTVAEAVQSNGVLVSQEEGYPALAQAISDVIEDRDVWRKRSEQIRNQVLREFSEVDQFVGISHVYEQVAA